MAEALSAAAGHNYSRHQPAPAASDLVPPQRETPRARTPVPPSREGKKPVTGFFEPAVSRQLKRLGLDRDCTLQELLQEAINDLFQKHELPPIA
jgi:hypothetical protein